MEWRPVAPLLRKAEDWFFQTGKQVPSFGYEIWENLSQVLRHIDVSGTNIVRELKGASAHRVWLTGWQRANLAANLTSSPLDRFGSATHREVWFPVDVTIRTLAAYLSGTPAAETATVEVFVGGVQLTNVEVELSPTADAATATWTGGEKVVPALDPIDLRVTTTAGYLPVNLTLNAGIEVSF